MRVHLALPCLACILASAPLSGQTWEASLLGDWQTQTSSTYWEQGDATTGCLRGLWLAPRDEANRLWVEAGVAGSAQWTAQGLDGSQAQVHSRSASVGGGRETWFMNDRLAFTMGLSLRVTRLASSVDGAPEAVHTLPQLWIRLGLATRLWALAQTNRQPAEEPLRYLLLRLELGEAAPRSPSPTDELLPQREVTLGLGVRF